MDWFEASQALRKTMQAQQNHRNALVGRGNVPAVPVHAAPGVVHPAPGVAHPAPGVDNYSISLKEFLAILRRGRVTILLTIFAVTGLAALLAFQLTPRYTATADVMIEPREVRIIDLESVSSELPPDRSIVETELDVLRSKFLAQRVIEDLGLLSDAEINPLIQPENGQPSLFAGLADWVSRSWPTTVGAAGQLPAVFPTAEIEQADHVEDVEPYGDDRQMAATVRRLLEGLNVRQTGDSQVVSIDFTSTDPGKAAGIANGVAKSYVAGQREEKLTATQQAADWLTDRVDHLRRLVLDAERAVEEYRAANKMASSGGESLGQQELGNLNLQLLTAQAQRAEAEARLLRVRDVHRRGGSYGSLAEVMSSPIIIDLREREADLLRQEGQLSKEYGPQHPMMSKLAAEKDNLAVKVELEVANIVASLENEVAVARTREQALAKALEEAKERSAATSQAGIALRQFEREAEANRSLYEAFLKRLKETEEQLHLVRPDAKVVSPAEIPQVPSFPKPKFMIGIGFTSSVILGVLLAFLRERLDSVFHTGRQLHQVLGVPSFGLVPAIRLSKGRPRPHLYLLEKPLSAYADAIRSVQKSVELCRTDRRSQVVLVTSTLPREGKTTLTLSLAASVARSGRKVIVVDADLRNPSIAREIGQPCGPGLVEFLIGEASADQVIHTADFHTNLHFIPNKSLTPTPVDLLESRQMATLLAGLRVRYDHVLLDGPPALVTDTRAAALLADTILYAVQWNKTKAEIASHGMEALAGSHVSVTGLVLTQVDVALHAKYGYGDLPSYYKKYRKYYVN
jgi:polysaccharide biosynthesis transport protein